MLSRVLFISPSDSGLDVVPEITSLYAYNYNVQSVPPGPVTSARLFDLVLRQKFDIVHFACHADVDGILLDHSERMDAVSLVQFIRASGAVLVFLNGCDTVEIGQLLFDEEIPAVLCTLRKVKDEIAKQTAQLFYTVLAQTNDIRAAYHKSHPALKGGYTLLIDGFMEKLTLTPVIERLDQFEKILAANNIEHVEFRLEIRHAIDLVTETLQQKAWFLKVSGAVVAVGVLVQILITLIARAS